MTVKKSPDWCPHSTCQCEVSFQDKMCGGELPVPESHIDTDNTHRICIDTRETGHGIFDLMINKTDKYFIKRLLDSTIKEVPDGG